MADSKKYKSKTGYHVYKLVNENNEILYIGKSEHIYKRITNHLNGNNKNTKNFIHEVKNVYYITFETLCDMEMYEIFAINYYKPKYNIASVGQEGVGMFKLPIIDNWTLFNKEDDTIHKFEEEYIKIQLKNRAEELKNFNIDLILNYELDNFINSKINTKLSSDDMEKLLKIVNCSIEDINNILPMHDGKTVLSKDGFLIKRNRAKKYYGACGERLINGSKYFYYKSSSGKFFYGKNKKEICDKVNYYKNNVMV